MDDRAEQAPIRAGVRDLRDNLSGYLRQARQGASILVMSHDEVVAKMLPLLASPDGGRQE
jgi:antitoxin (DNA-binding transcriptional repressor) of toxin-antitoxin stability system